MRASSRARSGRTGSRTRRLVARLLFAGAVGAFVASAVTLGMAIGDAARGRHDPATLAPAESSAPGPGLEPASAATPPSREPPTATATEPAPAPAIQDPQIEAAIVSALEPDTDHYGVVVRRLGDGRGAAINADRAFYAASLFKLALLYEAERQKSEGLIDFDAQLQLQPEDLEEDLGTLDDLRLDDSGSLPVRAAVEAMITHSDNASAVAILHLLHGATVDETLAKLGLEHTSVNTSDLPTTAGDMAILMEAVETGRDLPSQAQAEMRDLLLRQLTRAGIPRLLPDGVPVGNKTGTWTGATHDVAFVDAPGGIYVLAVLSDRDWDWEPIARVSRAVFDVLSGE